MYSITTIAISVLIVLLIILIIWYLTSKNTTRTYKSKNVDSLDVLIDRMNKDGWILLTMKNCGHCENAKRQLGNRIHNIRHGCINAPEGNITPEELEQAKKLCRGYPSVVQLSTGKVVSGWGSHDRVLTEIQKLQ